MSIPVIYAEDSYIIGGISYSKRFYVIECNILYVKSSEKGLIALRSLN